MKSASIFVVMTLATTLSAGVRVDISPDNGRRDILTKGWANWIIKDVPSATLTVDNLTFTLTGAEGRPFTVPLWKGALDTGATVAADGATAASLQLAISGLAPGKHTLVTYHNFVDGPAAAQTISIGNKAVVDRIAPTQRATSDSDIASTYIEFEATAGVVVTVTIKPVDSTGRAILNGFEIDTIDPVHRAVKPMPAADDEHAVEDPILTWRAAKTATAHDIYFGTTRDAVLNATSASPEFKGNQKTTEFKTAGLDPWATYFWRVDEVNSDQPSPTKGEVWMFRVRSLAFPEAEGYGRFALGGRGGRVIEVTNLNDSGPGSLREACDAEGPRTVVFRVAGTIPLKSKIVISKPYITIAGQTAPGDGICVSRYTFAPYGTHDVIMRYMRIRISDESGQTNDGTGLGASDYSIIDHCSVSWSIDEGVSSRSARNITVQRTLISEPLNMSIHAAYVGTGKGHSYAGSISGDIGSYHHNLAANCAGRNWSLAGGLNQGGEFAGQLDIRNNVVYNWVHRTTDGGVKKLVYVNNYYIPGPATTFLHLIDPDAGIHPNTPDDFQRYYMAGNMMEGHPEWDADNWKSALFRDVDKGGPGTGEGLKRIKYDQPFFESYVKTDSALDAYKSVIADVGANYPKLDSHDQRIIEEVRDRTTHFVGSKTGMKGIIDSQKDVGGFPELKGAPAPADADHDGIPDSWETVHGLNPNDPSDGAKKADNGYSNLENYLNGILTAPRSV